MAISEIAAYLTPEDLYKRYQITSSTLDRWIRNKNFPKAFKVGQTRRFNIEAVLAWEAEQTEQDEAA